MSQPGFRHNAPAGQSYCSIQDAGRSTLEAYCDSYPDTNLSFIVPNLFPSSFPEVIGDSEAILTDKQKRQFDGFVRNLAGEREEYDIYLAFTSVVRQCPVNPILVIWGLKFDGDNGKAIKRNALKKELPSINLGPGEMSQEKDFIIFVRNYGVVFGEVKRSATKVNIEKAEEQLGNAQVFFQKMFSAISGPNGTVLPTSKLILIPGESKPSPTTKTPSGSHLVYKDMVHKFQAKWTEVVTELESYNANNPINPPDFEKLVQIITGIWAMKPFGKRSFQFNNYQASLASSIEEVDKRISGAVLSSEKGAQFAHNVPASSRTVSDCSEELNLFYFSPQQKAIFENHRHALIRAHAGCGKSFLILIKILSILQKNPTQKILLIATKPHHLRCKKILERNNVTAEIFPFFPYTLPSLRTLSPPSCIVVIVEVQSFFAVPKNTLLMYDLSLFNLFIDDLHGYKVPRKGDFSNFTDIGDFVDYAYSESKWNDKFCWFGLDAAQQDHRQYSKERKTTGLFLTKSGRERNFEIPVVVMDQILRNSREIVGLMEYAREKQVYDLQLDPSMMISTIQCGHHITSQKLIYHKLRYNKRRFSSLRTISAEKKFVCARVEELFSTLSSSSSSSSFFPCFDYSSVAILFDDRSKLSRYKRTLEAMLLATFNLKVQTIEEQLLHHSPSHVVMDHAANIQSFETAVLVYVRRKDGDGRDNSDSVYNIISRARTICTVVDVDRYEPSFPLPTIDFVQWEESNDAFTKVKDVSITGRSTRRQQKTLHPMSIFQF